MVLELKTNVAVFSAFKSHSQSQQYVDALIDPDTGKKRTYGAFRKAALEIDKTYNSTWLESEYNMATRQARAAKQWQGFVNDQDLYPNLEYMPSLSANQSPVHQRYYGLIKPIDDPIWNTLMPPSRWGCKCWVQQTREDATEEEFEAPEALPGVEGNPGKSGRVFSVTSPFILDKSKEEKTEIRKALHALRDAQTEVVKMKIGKNFLNVHVNADLSDLKDNINFMAPAVKQFKSNFQIRPNSNEKGKRNPEFEDSKGVIGDVVHFKGTNPVSFVRNAFDKMKSGNQLSEFDNVFICFEFNGKLTSKNYFDMLRKLHGNMSQSTRLQYVILKNGDKYVKLDQKMDFSQKAAEITKELIN